jgi:signal transduction histidine kinase
MRQYFKSVEGKLFLILTCAIGTAGIFLIAVHTERRIEEHRTTRIEKYEKTLELLSSSILQFERDAEAKMWLALQHLKHDDLKGIPSESALKRKAQELGMTHLFVIDRNGRFLRSTNEAPGLIPNLFSFSDEYRSQVAGLDAPIATPIIPPMPEVKPFKFLTVFHRSTGRFLHAGLRADFLEDALTRMVKADPEIEGIDIHSPRGTSLGHFERSGFQYERLDSKPLVLSPETVINQGRFLRLLHWSDSLHPDCSQCARNGDTRQGRHQYLFSLQIGNDHQEAWMRREILKAALYSLLSLLFAGLISFAISKRFTRRIRVLRHRIEESAIEPSRRLRLALSGSDEIAELSRLFQVLLTRLKDQEDRERILERGKIELAIARQLAHDLRSPLTTLEVLLSTQRGIPQHELGLLNGALTRISEIAGGLLQTREVHDGPTPLPLDSPVHAEQETLIFIHLLLEQLIGGKRIEYSGKGTRAVIEYRVDPGLECAWVLGPTIELRRALSNLINNAFESHPGSQSVRIDVALTSGSANSVRIQIRDDGSGIPPTILDRIGERGFTCGKVGGSGLGVSHAKELVLRLGGHFKITNRHEGGAEVEIELPLASLEAPLPGFPVLSATRVILIDDDPFIREALSIRFQETGTPFEAFASAREFKKVYSLEFERFEGALILMDHDLGNDPGWNGLDLICEMGLQGEACLFTGRFDDPDLMNSALQAGVRVIPKPIILGPLKRSA